MVNLQTPQLFPGEQNLPVMPKHRLTATKDTRSFKKGETAVCFIAKMSDGRFEVMDANFSNTTKHFEVFTEEELHASFEEVESLVEF